MAHLTLKKRSRAMWMPLWTPSLHPPQRLAQLATATNADEKLRMAMKCVRHSWPDYLKNFPPQIHDLFAVRTKLSVLEDLLVRG